MSAAVFVVGSLLLLGAAAVLVLRALGRTPTEQDAAPERVRGWLRASIRRELEDARASGDLRPEDLPTAESDLGRMVEAYGRATAAPPRRVSHPLSRTAVVVLMVVLALGLYGVYGGWRYVFFGPRAAQRHDLRLALHRYRRHLARHPGDVRGWRALARGYELLGHDRRAAAAYHHLLHHGGGKNPGVLADYAQVLILAQHGRLDARELALTHRALRIDPDQPKALWWGGLLELAVAHDRARALRLWNRLLENPTLPSTVRGIVASRVVALGGTPAQPPVSEDEEGKGAVWRVHVSDALATRATPVPAGARLYVFLRNPSAPESPPYYVRVLPHPAFPLVVALSPSDSPMGPPSHLPREVELVALLSMNGLTSPAPGDLEGRRIYARSYLRTAHRLRVRIDERLGDRTRSPDSHP